MVSSNYGISALVLVDQCFCAEVEPQQQSWRLKGEKKTYLGTPARII